MAKVMVRGWVKVAAVVAIVAIAVFGISKYMEVQKMELRVVIL